MFVLFFDISLSMSLARPGRILTARYDFHDHVRLATTGDVFVIFVSYAVGLPVYWKFRCRNTTKETKGQTNHNEFLLERKEKKLVRLRILGYRSNRKTDLMGVEGATCGISGQ